MTEAKKPQDHKTKTASAVTVQGIELSATREEFERRLKDWDVAEGLTVMNDTLASGVEKLSAAVKVMRLILVDDYERIKKELRDANDGVLDEKIMSAFLQNMFESYAPNS